MYLPFSTKSAQTIKSVIKLVKLFSPDSYSFFDRGDFNLPNINWKSSNFNESHEFFLGFCTGNFLTQVIEKQNYKMET